MKIRIHALALGDLAPPLLLATFDVSVSCASDSPSVVTVVGFRAGGFGTFLLFWVVLEVLGFLILGEF